MEHKVFETPHSHDAEFYKDREVADHINQSEHRPRLLKAAEEIIEIIEKENIGVIGDFGCGNGGLLGLLTLEVPAKKYYGYDLSPKAVEYAISRNLPVSLVDFTVKADYPELLILTETLEHLVDPHGLLKRARPQVKWVVASTPAYETENNHYEHHLWVWTGDSFRKMFEAAKFEVIKFYEYGGYQFIVAK